MTLRKHAHAIQLIPLNTIENVRFFSAVKKENFIGKNLIVFFILLLKTYIVGTRQNRLEPKFVTLTRVGINFKFLGASGVIFEFYSIIR